MACHAIIRKLFILLSVSSSLLGFDQKPWMGDFLQFHFIPSFTYRSYPSVDRAYNPSHYSSHDRYTTADLEVCFLPSWDAQVGLEFADTREQALGLQSGGVQVRYQFLNDIGGDSVSFTSGLNIRGVSKRSLKDVSCVYANRWNFEIVNSVGKEFAYRCRWFFRTFAFLGVGQATKGRPWVRGLVFLEGNLAKKHKLSLFTEGYFGFGKNRFVNIDDFNGYGNIFHQSIDVGAAYTYDMSKIWGNFTFSYNYRVFAKAFPKNAQTYLFAYNFPFSFF